MRKIIKNLFQKKNFLRITGFVLILSFFLFIPVGIGGMKVAHASWFSDVILDVAGFGANTIASIAAEVLSWLLEWVWIPILSWVLTVVGNLFDQALNFSLNMANLSSLQGIKDGWMIVRDLINLSFIFLLLYIAINTMLGTSNSADKKILANLVIAAILINFSYFITGLIIDAGNIVALAFRNAIHTSGQSGGLGALIMNAIKVAELYEPSGFGYSSFISVGIRSFVVGLSIYAIGAATLLFIVRVVSFIILLILSPIGFVGSLSPKFAEQSKNWWTNLINQTLVAPIFLFFFYIIARITEGGGFFKNMLDTNSGANIDVTYYFNFVIIIGLLLTAVKLSKKFGGELGGKVVGFAGTLGKIGVGLLGAASLGGLAMAGRAGLGRGASAILSKTGKGLAEAGSERGIKGLGARLALRSLKGTEKASFDIRGTEIGKKTLGLAKGISFGKAGGSGGFKEKIKETAREERKKMGELFGTNEKQKERYAQEVLQKPFWARGKKIDPESLLGKMSKNVQAGAMIEKESGLRSDMKDEMENIKILREQIKNDLTLKDNQRAEMKIKIKDSRENITYIREELKELAGEPKKKD